MSLSLSDCDRSDIEEYEVLSLEGDTAYVLTNKSIRNSQFVEGDNFMKISYQCLTQENDVTIAVVCGQDHGHGGDSHINKCCPPLQSLTHGLQCSTDHFSPLPPRNIISPHTLLPTAHYQTRVSAPVMCQDHVTVPVSSVTTTGQYHSSVTGDTGDYECVDTLDSVMVAVTCVPPAHCHSSAHHAHGCVSKCCPVDQVFSHDDPSLCVNTSNHHHLWSPGDTAHHHQFLINYLQHKHHQRPECEDVVILDHHEDDYIILDNGSLHHLDYGVTDNYCVDNVLEDGAVSEIVLKCFSGGERVVRNITSLVSSNSTCLEDYYSGLRLVNTITGIISCSFLIITFLVYISVPELNNLHGKIVLSNVVSIFFLTSYLVLVYQASHVLNQTLCTVAGNCLLPAQCH